MISESFSDEEDHDEEARLKILDNALQALPEREKDIILARYLSDPRKTLVELSGLLGVSVERVRQLEANALKKLRISMAESEEHM
ncbi:RNA polymerase sigma factor RpoH [compost metagenome]